MRMMTTILPAGVGRGKMHRVHGETSNIQSCLSPGVSLLMSVKQGVVSALEGWVKESSAVESSSWDCVGRTAVLSRLLSEGIARPVSES